MNINDVPLFDCLTHPMPNGNWMHTAYDGKNSIQVLLESMERANVKWALAVGMGTDIGGYKEATYADFVRSHSEKLFPIAYLDVMAVKDYSTASLSAYFKSLKKAGYVGIKMHPRLGKFSLCDEFLVTAIRLAVDHKLCPMLCTYCWENSPRAHLSHPYAMMDLLNKLDNVPIILVHAGGVHLLQYIEIARAFSNVLLDLSLTLCKYEGSSIDQDIRFAFSLFDRRICVGSDGPEYSAEKMRARFNLFTEGLSEDKVNNVGYLNLQKFIHNLSGISF
ncbi:amidohydrolase family protein [Thalassotalea montiporae]